MKAIRPILLGCLIASLSGLGCSKQPPDSPDVEARTKENKAKLLAFDWILVNADGEEVIPGAKVLRFTKEFGVQTYPAKLAGLKRPGYKVKGDSLTFTIWKEKSAVGRMKKFTIKTLDDKGLVLEDDKGKTHEFKSRPRTAAVSKENLLGEWLAVKSEGGWRMNKGGFPRGARVVIGKDGRVSGSWRTKAGEQYVHTFDVYTLKGNKLTLGKDEGKQTLTIKTLTDGQLVTEDENGKTDEFRKKYRDALSRANQAKIVGTWEVVKNNGYVQWPRAGATMEFTKEGKIIVANLKQWSNATWAIDENKLEATYHDKSSTIPTINTLTDDKLILMNDLEFKRKK